MDGAVVRREGRVFGPVKRRVFKPLERRVFGPLRERRLLRPVMILASVLLALVAVLVASLALAAPYTVNSTADRVDANIGNGECRTSVGTCTLRAAIQEANATSGHDTIEVSAGIYELGIPTVNDDLPSTGDFDITDTVTIVGAGTGATFVDGGVPLPSADPNARGIDRLFEVHPTAGNVTFSRLTLREGFAPEDGAGIQNWSPGLLRLDTVHVKDNLAGGVGGGINNAEPVSYDWETAPLNPPKSGRVEIVNSTFSGNASGGGGAAVNNSGTGTVSILANSKVVDNPGEMIPDPQDPEGVIPAAGVYEPSAGAIANQAEFDVVGTIKIADSTVARNYAGHDGAGVANLGSGTLTIERSTITDNTTEAEGGGVYSTGGRLTITGGTISANHAHEGGGIYSGGANDKAGLRSRVTITGTKVENNIAEAGGGGISSGGDAQVDITDAQIIGNVAGDAGGGLANGDRAGLALTRVTFTGNITNNEGGGAHTSGERPVVIRDSVFTKNKAGVPEQEDGVPEPGDANSDPSANIAGGGGITTETGPVEISKSTFTENTATDEGGGLSIDNFGDFKFSDSVVTNNRAGTDGGGLENSGFRVTFERLKISGNRAELDGGGIHNTSSAPFNILDTTIEKNSAVNGGGIGNAPDNDMIVRRSLILRNTARNPGLAEDGTPADGGYGGGLYSQADGDSQLENTTITGNTAARGGGGLFHDADGELKLTHLTIWRNAAPRGGGIGVVESDFVPDIPPKANISVIVRNTVVGGSRSGGSCDFYVTSDGGNVDTGGIQETTAGEGPVLPAQTACFLSTNADSDAAAEGIRDRYSPTFTVDALADNGGATLTHALPKDGLAIDTGMTPCPETDQRGVERPQNGKCDAGAVEYEGPPPPVDNQAPDTEYISGPTQDSLVTVSFQFTGSDDKTAKEELQYECRLVENDPAEPQEPVAPWDPVPPELWWHGCQPGWQAPLVEESMFTFEVRAIDRAGNIDPTPARHIIDGMDTSPPQTIIAEKPPAVTPSRAATFSFSGTDNQTPAEFMEYECRIDTRDPDLWLECFNPTIFSNLTSGQHTVEVRATDAADNMDPTPARYTWTVGQRTNCDQANITMTSVADAWVDQVNPAENFLFHTDLAVRSGATGDPTAVPPEPVVGQNARAMYRFALPNDATDCTLESATLRLYNESPTDGRRLNATLLNGPFKESTATWSNQPGSTGSPVTTDAHEGYQEWNVLGHVKAMYESGNNHGWRISDANENDPDGGDQAFVSREMLQDPPPATLPQLVLKYEADASPAPDPPTPATNETTVRCGQVLKESTLVANDLLGCPGEGLVVGAPNIVVDLNGHTISSGVLVETGQETGLIGGVRNSGHENVVIRNGKIKGFGYGVMLTGGTTRNVVEDLKLEGNLLAGLELNDADDGRNGNTIRDNYFTANGEAAMSLVNGSENSVITGNTFEGNGGVAFQLVEANGHRFENNTVSGIPIDAQVDSDAGADLEGSSDNVFKNNKFNDFGDAGLIFRAGSARNLAEGNELVRSGDAGINIQDSPRNQVIDNVAHGSSDGGVVINNGNDTVVKDNDLRFNPSGVEASNSNNLLIQNNNGSESLQAGFEIGNGLNIKILNNTANQTGGAGISMEGGAFDANSSPVGGALIEGNTTNDNRESGISVADGGHSIRANNAHNNAGWGINAGENPEIQGQPFPGTNIDGGNNKATGNGEIGQCSGVICNGDNPVPPSEPDTSPPDTSITEHPPLPPDSTGDTFAKFKFSATDTGANGAEGTPLTAIVFECRLDPPPDPTPEQPEPDPEPPHPNEPPDTTDPVDPGNWNECSNPMTYQGLEPGEHHFEVRARDNSDNVDPTPAKFDWDIDPTAENDEDTGPDSTPPNTRISSAPENETTSKSATFGFAGTDNATLGLSLTFECRLDGGAFESCTTPKSYDGLSVGSHTFEVRATDRTGNKDETSATHTWTINEPPRDVTPPETTLDATGPDPITSSTGAKFEFSSNETDATFECSIDSGTTWETCASPKEYTNLAVGDREFRVRAVDAAGNPDDSPARYAWTITSAPVATTVFCGQTITRSILVRNDLTDCVDNGLVIGADQITVDLNGHTIDGKGLGAGIRNDGYDKVAITNSAVEDEASLEDFDYGVMLNTGAANNTVESLTLERNQEAGVSLGTTPPPAPNAPQDPLPSGTSGVNGNTIQNNAISANEAGIWVTNGAKDNVIRDNELGSNGKEGIWIERSTNNKVENNEITGSSNGAVILRGSNDNTVADNTMSENGAGVTIGDTEVPPVGIPSTGNRVERNTVSETGGDALELDESHENELIDNVVQGSNGSGINMDYSRDNLARGNDLRANKAGIALSNSTGNRLEANNTSESEGGSGISLQALSLNNEIVGNTSSNTAGDGIYVGDAAASGAGMLIEGNTTNNNLSDGIYIPKPAHTITNNVSHDNVGWGIWASPESSGRSNLDGGNNRAQGNLGGTVDPVTKKPEQCLGVRCDGSAGTPDQIQPDTLLLESPPDPSPSDSATFRFNGTDNKSTVTFQCRLEPGPHVAFKECTSPKTYENLSDIDNPSRQFTFQVRAMDTSQNVDATPETYTWTVDPSSQALETSIDSGPDATTVSKDAKFEFSSNRSGSTFECKFDSGAFSACTSPKEYTGLTEGEHQVQVRATDAGGNTDQTPATFTWTIGPQPVAARVECGEFVEQSTVVQNDLLNCPGPGLIIGAPNITVDLDGHIVDGTVRDVGILNNGHDNVTISNGIVHEFADGVQLNPGTGGNIISSLRAEANTESGISLSDADEAGKGNILRDNTVVSNAFGIILFSGTRNAQIRDNSLGANTQDGIRINQSVGNRVENNEVTGSGGAGIVMEGGNTNTVTGNTLTNNNGYSIAVGADLIPSNDNRVEDNTVRGGTNGIAITESTGNQVLYNTVREATGPGMTLDLSRNTIVRGNDLAGNGGGISLSESTGNKLESNHASGTMGTGIELGELSLNNEVLNNTASDNTGDGIDLVDLAPTGQGNLVKGNTANDNGGDGIIVDAVGHTITENTVNSNGGWGIYAAVGATDGGGNKAAGNVEPEQCFGVVCEIGTIPGAPETAIVEHPPAVSNSRNASFTYTGKDEADPLNKLLFECRLDSNDPLAWEDCEYPAEFLNLNPGQHTFEVRAVDTTMMADPSPAKYTWTYEPLPANDAPETTIDLKPEAETWAYDALFTFHANEPDVGFECKIDNLPYEPCGFMEPASYMSMGAFEWAFEETEAGSHTFSVRATDFEGNVGEPATYTWSLFGVATVFTDGPGFVPATGGPAGDPATGGPTQSNDATIKFEANVADATFECSIDLEPFVPCSSPARYTNLLPGDHMLRVIATGPDGVSELEAAEYEWEIVDFNDAEPPDTTIERAPATNSSDTIFEFVGTDNLTTPELLTYECRIDSTNELDWEACTNPYNLLDFYTYQDIQMAPGEHTFEVRAIDAADPEIVDPSNPNFEGNVDPTPAKYTWTMAEDTTAPGTGILSAPAAKTGQTEATFEFLGNDNATPNLKLTFECALDNGAFEPCQSPHSVSGLEPGEHTLQVRTVDLAGNKDATPSTHTWTVVATPVTTIAEGPAGRIVDGQPPAAPNTNENAIFKFSADQSNSTYECSLDGAEFAPCTSPHAYWIVEDGTHEFEVRATNPEGVVEEPSARYEWAVELGPDTIKPETRITRTPSNPDGNTVATFEFTGSDNRTPTGSLSYECALDGGANPQYNSCTSPQQFSDLQRGQHVMLIRAKDAAGNFDGTPARYEWRVAPPPVTTITSGPADVSEETSNRNATFTFTADEPGSTFQCWLDGKLEPCAPPKTYTNLGYGKHDFQVLATNAAGVVEAEWVEYEWTILPPPARLDATPASNTENTSATFEFSSPDPQATFQCSLDGANFVPCDSPKNYERLWPGAHRFQVQAIYPNMAELGLDPVPVTHEWTIADREAPDTSIEYGPPNTTASTIAFLGISTDDPTATIECTLDGQPSSCEPPVAELTDLTVGAHRFTAQATDPAGNVDPTPAEYTWTVTVSPANNTPVGAPVTVNLPMPNGTGTATATFAEVTVAGATWIEALNGGPALPGGYAQGGGRLYDVNTTAEYGQPVTLCFPYDPASFSTRAIRLLHYDGSTWTDVTTTNNPNTGLVCGEAESLSPFAIVAANSGAAPEASILSTPPNPSDSPNATFEFEVDAPDAMTQCSIDGLPFEQCTSPVTYRHLDNGDHSFEVQAISADGYVDPTPALYEWVIELGPDTTEPETTITKGPPARTGSYRHMVEFTGSDDQTAELELEFECLLDGESIGTCSSPHEFEVLTPGEHTIEVSAIDVAGNRDSTPAKRTFTVVDVTAPDTIIDLGPNSETEESTATFEFSAEPMDPETELGPNTTFQCSLDNADFTDCTSPHTVTNLAPGPHTFEVRAKDAAGNADPSPDIYEWLVTGPADTTPPETTIESKPPQDNSGPDVTFGFSSNEPVSEFECMLDNGPWESCEAMHEIMGLTSGQHTIQVRAIDAAEIPNTDPTPVSYTWTVLGEPETTITDGPKDMVASEPGIQTNSPTARFEFSSDQEGATFQCTIDGGAEFTPCTSPHVAGPLADETTYTFEVRAVNQYRTIDREPVVDMTPATNEWTVQDASPPDTTLKSVTYLGWSDLIEPNSLRFEFEGTDNRTSPYELTFECSLDGEPFSGCDAPNEHYLPLEGLAAGQHTFEIRAMDDLGNVDPTPVKHTFSTDAVPETTIDSGPDAQTGSTEATFAFSSDPAGATFECSLDKNPETFTACPADGKFTDVPYGEHQLLVRAVGPGGPDQTPAEHTWVSGHMAAPVATISSGPTATSDPTATTESTTARFEFSSSDQDPGLKFQCSIDGGPPAFCTSPKEYTNLQPGVPHTFEVQATKPNLLIESEPAVWEWTILDNAAPETEITNKPADPSAENVTFEFKGTDNGTLPADINFECALDAAEFSGCSSPLDLQNLTAGEHTLQVRAIDGADPANVDSTPASYTWTAVTPPATAITSQPENPSTSADATFEFSDQPGATYECALETPDTPAGEPPPFEPCESPKEYTGLKNGAHVFQVQATNRLGIVEEAPVEYAWTVNAADTTVPDTKFDSTPPATTPNTSATFGFSGTDNQTPAAELTFECSLDGEPFSGSNCSSPRELLDLAVGEHKFEVQATDEAGNVDPMPASYTWTVEPPPPPNTEPGTDVTVELPIANGTGTATATFAEVTTAGTTTAAALDNGSLLPEGYLQAGALYYDISTTAEYTAPVTVCLPYNPDIDPVRLLHYDGSNWTDITTSVAAGQVCGDADSLSPFAIAAADPAMTPETTILDGPASETVSTEATFTFESSDPGADFECALDTPANEQPSWGSCGSRTEPTKTYKDLAVGEHELLVRAKNNRSQVDLTPATYRWTIKPLPETTIDPASGPTDQLDTEQGVQTEETGASFTFSSDQPGATFECSLDATETTGSYEPCTSPKTYTGLAFGEYDFFVRAVDADGNVDPTPAEFSWEIADITSPETTIESKPNATTSETRAGFTFSSNELDATFECSLDESPFGPCSSPRAYTGLTAGEHTLRVQAVDPAQNIDPTPATYTWTVDTTAPQTSLGDKPDVLTSGTGATFAFTGEAGATFECKLDGAEFTGCSSPQSYTDLSDGSHTFSVRSTDAAGNVEAPVSHSWTIDAIAPETTIDSKPDALTGSTSASFTFSSEPGSTFECKLDAGQFTACDSPEEYTGLADGEHTLEVRATDAAGNTAAPVSHTWTVDATAPEATLTDKPADTTTATGATFAFTGEAGATFECALDGAEFTGCTSPSEYTDLEIGPHTFEVRATDAAGNTAAPVSHSWKVEEPPDTAAPETQITDQPAKTSNSPAATLSFTGTDNKTPAADLRFECRLDGQTEANFSSCTSPQSYSGLGQGSHTFDVRTVDQAGNTDPTPESYTWTVDTAAPQTTIDSKPEALTKSTTSSFTFTGEAGATFECKLDNGSFTGCSSPQSYADLSDGSHTFSVRSTDAAGNVETPVSHTWTVDATVPQATIDSPPPASTIETNATFTFSADELGAKFECSLDGAPFAECASPKEYTGLALGQHTFNVRATDAAGNTGSPTDYVWTIEEPADITAPDTQITGQPVKDTNNTAATFSFTGTDNKTPAADLRFECQLDNQASGFVPCTSPQSYSGLGQGLHTFEVRAVDQDGNIGNAVGYTWTVDTAAPQTTIGSKPEALTTSTSARFTFTSEPGSIFECALDAAAFAACASPKDYTGLASGEHTFKVRAIDAIGNVEAPVSHTWTVDANAPQTTLDASGPSGTTTATSASFVFSSNETGSKFECSLDGAPFAECASPKQYTSLSVGNHEFRVRSIDRAGNIDGSPESRTWTVQAQSSCVATTVTAKASADSSVYQKTAARNFGTDPVLRVNPRTGERTRSLVRFDIPTIPTGCQVTSAELRLYNSSPKAGRTIQALPLAGTWTESVVNWNNQPATTGQAATSSSPSAAAWMKWSVTEQVKGMYTGGNHGFLIRDAAEGSSTSVVQQFHSNQTTAKVKRPPELVITFN